MLTAALGATGAAWRWQAPRAARRPSDKIQGAARMAVGSSSLYLSPEDSRALGRYELVEQDHIVFADYRRDGERVFIDHVETPPALRGAGAAGRLMEAIAAAARLEGLT